MKKVYSLPKIEAEDSDIKQKATQAKNKADVATYVEKVQEHGYINYSNSETIEKAEETIPETLDTPNVPYVISPDEFAEFDDYEKVSLIFYADQVLTDDNNDLIDANDIENLVGFESLASFGEYEDDSVYVRNDRLKCDFEILYDQRTYKEVVIDPELNANIEQLQDETNQYWKKMED